MFTITHNDLVPEMLASIRRGPFAEPTESERVEYLFTRIKTNKQRADFENYALEHVLSYQRRVVATKESFLKRNSKSPLGIVTDGRWTIQSQSYIDKYIVSYCSPKGLLGSDRSANASRITRAYSLLVQGAKEEG